MSAFNIQSFLNDPSRMRRASPVLSQHSAAAEHHSSGLPSALLSNTADKLVGGATLNGFFRSMFEGSIPDIVEEICQFWGVESEFKKLRRVLYIVKALYKDAEQKIYACMSVSEWVENLKEVAYIMESILDIMQTRIICLKMDNAGLMNQFELQNINQKFQEGIRKEMIKAVDWLEEIVKDAHAIGLGEKGLAITSLQRSRLPASPSIDRCRIYGRNNDKEQVIGLVLATSDSKRKYSTIGIVGIGGIGKTTLAQLVFNDESIISKFEVRSWACVSDVFDVGKVTKELVEYLTQAKCHNLSVAALQALLENLLSGKRFLIVLDDMWTDKWSDWDRLIAPFSCCADGSQIIITSRSEKVSRSANCITYKLTSMKNEECWALFKEKAFGDDQSHVDVDLEATGKKIVEKCRGVPLVAKVVGGILRHNTSAEKWKSILHDCHWNILINEDELFPTLRISYLYLPLHLKRCFEYFSLFPSDYRFNKDNLVRLWIAEGFVEAQEGRELEDIGSDYYAELQLRSLIEPDDKVHGLIHDLACLMSGKFYANLIAFNSFRNVKSVMHASISNVHVEGIKTLFESNSLRTFVFCGEEASFLSLLAHKFMQWRFLKVVILELGKFSVPGLLNSFENLKHLRYLRLCDHCLESLPSSLSSLPHLQTLDLSGCCKLRSLSQNLGDLVSMRYINLSYSNISSLPVSFGELHNMRIVHLEYCENILELPENMGSVENLRDINLSFTNISRLPDSICNCRKLERLNLHFCTKFAELPEHIGCLVSLRYIDLSYSSVSSIPDAICELHNLLRMDLGSCKNITELPKNMGSLTSLQFVNLSWTNVSSLPHSFCRLVNLQELNLQSCKGILELPKDIGDLVSLQVIDLSYTNIRGLPNSICNIVKLQKMDLGSCECITELPEDMGNLQSLRSLVIVGTKISTLPDSISKIACLQELDCEYCGELVKMPKHFGNLVNIQKLGRLPTGKKEEGRGIGELKRLNSIQGKLVICNLEKVESTEEAAAAELKNKKYLKNLAFKWSPVIDISGLYVTLQDGDFEMKVLEALEPHPTSLTELSISNYGGHRLPTWLLELQFLSLWRLEIKNAYRLRKFGGLMPPLLEYLIIRCCQSLRELPIIEAPILKHLGIDDCVNLQSLPEELCNFTSLESLSIWNCPQLEVMDNDKPPLGLQTLNIQCCPKLVQQLRERDRKDWLELRDTYITD